MNSKLSALRGQIICKIEFECTDNVNLIALDQCELILVSIKF